MTILVTGSEGYLASQLIDRLLDDEQVKGIIGVDIRESSMRAGHDSRYTYIRASVTDEALYLKLPETKIDTVVHSAWTFNPTHDITSQDAVDIDGTGNILDIVLKLGVRHFFYIGSTTAYGQLPENPWKEPFLKESSWENNCKRRLESTYRYARNKAIVDQMVQEFAKESHDIKVGWIRGAIVLGPKTQNIVSYLAEAPFTFGRWLFRVKGPVAPMQFISEEDMIAILHRATMEKWQGPVNVAGVGTVSYSEIIKILGRKEICLPSWVLYPLIGLLWFFRLLPFPPSILDLTRYPWVADISRLTEEFQYKPLHSSREAIEQFAQQLEED